MEQTPVFCRDGWPIDHIALGVPDTEKAIRALSVQTGIDIPLKPPEPGQFYWSGGVMLGGGAFLELLGPNPDHKGWHPLIATVRQFSEPQLIFWYVGTDRLDDLAARIRPLHHRIEREETVGSKHDDSYARYRRAVIGPGIASARPMVIEWHHRPPRMDPEVPDCRIRAFRLTSPKAQRLRDLFAVLGVEQPVSQGPQRLELEIDTPAGPIAFAGPGVQLESPLDWLGMGIRLMAGRFSRAG